MSLTIARRIYLLVTLFVTAIAILLALMLNEKRQSLLEQRIQSLDTLTEVMAHIIDRSYRLYREGKATEEEAKRRALSRVISTPYGNGNYFFVQDTHQIMLAHPNPNLIGTDQSKQVDGAGILFNAKVVPEAIKTGNANVTYLWPRNGEEKPVRKVSTYRYYEPWGWVIGTGLYTDDIDEAVWASAKDAFVSIAVILAALIFVAALIGRSILKPLAALRVATMDAAGGAIDADLPGLERRDEIGDMARSLDVMCKNEAGRRQLAAEQLSGLQERAQRSAALGAAAHAFDKRVGGLIGNLQSSAEGMEETVRSLTTYVAAASDVSTKVLDASVTTSENVRNAADAASMLSSTIDEAAANVAQVAGASSRAVSDVREAESNVRTLLEAAEKIGGIIAVINNIAGQTNLLALNATIEAARAGEAGRGFSIVAGEVKTLATQTAQSTQKIEAQIAHIQAQTLQAVNAVQSVLSKVAEIHRLSERVSSALEDQGRTTREIAGSVQGAARGAQTVALGVRTVQEQGERERSAADRVLVIATEVSRSSTDLTAEVTNFLTAVRAA